MLPALPAISGNGAGGSRQGVRYRFVIRPGVFRAAPAPSVRVAASNPFPQHLPRDGA
jgi:hypothetical protein